MRLFLVGLLGGTHCVGMCGGIVAAISLQLPGQGTRFSYHFAYNAGRILSYAMAGGIAGAVGASTLLLKGFWPVQQGLYVRRQPDAGGAGALSGRLSGRR